MEYPLDKCLHELIEQQAMRTPNAPALRFGEERFSYAELNAHANQCARYLQELGAGPNKLVAVMMERSSEMSIALLAVLKAGAAYLPLDPNCPADRLYLILEDASVSIVLTQEKYASKLDGFEGSVFSMDLEGSYLAKFPTSTPAHTATHGDLAYVIYTSGSTGKPKGCMISHKAICNRLLWMKEEYGIASEDRILQKNPFTFDVSVWEFFLPYLAGACSVIAKPKGHQDNAYLVRKIIADRITVCHFVPSMLRFFLNQPDVSKCSSLRHMFVSGEALAFELAQKFERKLSARLHNLYGPTEAAVDVTYWEWEQRTDRVVPIGRPIRNIQIYILDQDLKQVPAGEAGELYIGGVGLAKGYLKRPELTKEKFIQNPFSKDAQSKLYRSGDSARFLDDGNIEFIGRIDSQVKLRGFRIELGEVEATLEQHEAVEQAVVLVQDADTIDPKMVAYLVASGHIESKGIRNFVKQSLPEYMVPNVIVKLEEIPVTRHGKVNRKALPWPVDFKVAENGKSQKPKSGQPAPRKLSQEVAAELMSICKEIVGIDALKSDDGLYDLGATSFMMVQIVDKVLTDFGVAVPVEVFLDDPSVRAITAFVQQALQEIPTDAEPANMKAENRATVALDQLQTKLQGYIAEVIGIDRIGLNDDLFDLGATSFTIVQIVEIIQANHGVTVPVEVFLDDPTLGAVVEYLVAEGTVEQQLLNAIQLQQVSFDPEAYDSGSRANDPSETSIPRHTFCRFMSLLRQETVANQARYLYSSAGGLNPIQTYVYLKPNGVEGLTEGVYYYHPVENSLYPLSNEPLTDPDSIFLEYDRPLFDQSGFLLFFVAQMKTIAPVYKCNSPMLAILESGYMGQLLTGRQADFNLELCPVIGIDFERISQHFKLDPEHQFIHCLIGGNQGQLFSEYERTGGTYSRIDYLRRTGTQLHAHCEAYTGDRTFASFLGTVNADFVLPTKEEGYALHGKQVQIRAFQDEISRVPMEKQAVDARFFQCRAAKRTYREDPVSFGQFSKFLSLLRPEKVRSEPKFLYPSVTDTYSTRIYLYVKENGVERVPSGIYQYDPLRHELTLINTELSTELRSCYTPFNQKHAERSAFAMFLIAPLGKLMPVYQDDSTYLSLLEAGYIGQLLLEKQAEFEMGLCPIGAMRFQKIRDDFKLDAEDELLHSFVCGGHEVDLPADWNFLEAERGKGIAAKVSVERGELPVQRQEIAIVGMSGRYPGADNLEQYWQNLKQGKNSFGKMPEERAKLYRSDQSGTGGHNYQGAFLRDIDCFDSRLFRIAPVEAKTIDPQERLLLEVVWECLENSGYTSENLKRSAKKIGIFVGVMWDDYQHYATGGAKGTPKPLAMSHHSSVANRISYYFDFSGPSIALNTSCSSAMTAIHFACNSIQQGECEAAIVGAVNLMSHPYHYDSLEMLDLLSESGECHPFGLEGNGWVAGEGVGAILIKPKDIAERDRDYIHGIIKGTAVGHSGKSVRFGAPNSNLQKASIIAAIENAAVPAYSISYVEAAASGASMADASEMSAIKAVFKGSAAQENAVYIGSVKANIGHLESASAMSQLMKVVLQLQHRQLCPTISIGSANPMLQLQESGLALNEVLRPWEPPAPDRSGQGRLPRRALINAFGATGSGGHLIVEEYILPVKTETEQEHLILLSAATEPQLRQLAGRLRDFLSVPAELLPLLSDLAFTLRTGRVRMWERLAMVVRSHSELRERLDAYLQGQDPVAGCVAGRASEEVTEVGEVRELSLAVIAEKWVQGTDFRWETMVQAESRRVPLPTYPFAKERHWLRNASQVRETATQPAEIIAPVARKPEKYATDTASEQLRSATETYLKKLFSQSSEIPLVQINAKSTFDAYGVTSLMIKGLNARIEKDFGRLSRSLFFEYKTIRELAEYFLREHTEKLAQLFGYATLPAVTEFEAHVDEAPGKNHAFTEGHAYREDAIAVVGLGGKYPKANDIDTFWENLKNGVDCITEIPSERWDHAKYYDQDRTKAGKTYAKGGGFIDGYDRFDPIFFNITPREAEGMDPQERLFLQTVWHTFEDAGYSRETFWEIVGRRVGVFVGVMYGEYHLFSPLNSEPGNGFAVGSSHGSVAHRVSYCFDFSGPSMAVDTMCSSSLTALHLAVNSVKNGECDAAIVGGVNLSIHPNKYVMHAQINMSASDGRCRSFGEGGDGFVPGEGIGAILIKPLNKAIEDGDQIYATIKGTSVNHNGRTHGYTVPNPTAQAAMISDALRRHKVDAGQVSYVEAHGTGTSLGDPVEITGLTKAFRAYTDKHQYCSVGSVKSNIGHLESAAGIAGLTKILLQIKHGMLVPSLHSKKLNPNIDFEQSPFYIQQRLTKWERLTEEIDGKTLEYPRIACISSFGAGGANAHAIIEEYSPVEVPAAPHSGAVIVPLSAKDPDRLKAYAENLLAFTQKAREGTIEPPPTLCDLAYTMQVGRDAMDVRLGLVVHSMKELEARLQNFVEGNEDLEGVFTGQVRCNADSLLRYAADEDLVGMIGAWIAKKKYGELLDLWCKGLSVDWEKLYGEARPRRISAPAYPFAGERYWVETPVVPMSGGSNGFSAPVPETSIGQSSEGFGTLMLKPVWQEMPVTLGAATYTAHQVLFSGVPVDLDRLQEQAPRIRFAKLHSDHLTLSGQFSDHALDLFTQIQTTLRQKPKGNVLVQVLVSATGAEQVSAGLSGLLKTAHLENPKLHTQVIAVDKVPAIEQLLAMLAESSQLPEAQEIRYEGKRQFVRRMQEVSIPEPAQVLPWKSGGVYLLTGGTGGLGMIFAKEIAAKASDAKLILAGRSELSNQKKAALEGLRNAGASVDYRRVDVGDQAAVEALMQSIESEYGQLNGIIHSAGIHRDHFILKKDPEEFAKVLSPKVDGAFNLDESTRYLDLDIFVLFSSGNGVTGNVGQADYACANAFLDSFARYRNSLAEAKERHGRTVSINWPFWRSGGMQVDAATQQTMYDRLGLLPMETSAGCTAFYQALASTEPQVIVAEGDLAKMKAALLTNQLKPASEVNETPVDAIDTRGLHEKTAQRLKSLLSEVTKIPVARIDPEEVLESYGIDSIMITRLNQKLVEVFEELPQTLFFEYQTLKDLTAYFVDQYAEACVRWTGLEKAILAKQPTKPAINPVANAEQTVLPVQIHRKPAPSPAKSAQPGTHWEPIAIIGMSGRYPQADNLDAYWNNLKSGKDCIVEIPKDRWDVEGFYGADRKEAVANRKSYSKWGGFLDDFAAFDPLFFNISPRETMNMDPQERLFLQSCWELLEDAGYTKQQLATQFNGNVGVFAGITKTGFELYGPELWKRGEQLFPRTSFSSVANRVSYLLNLRGPSMPIDTMCSSSLTAIHEACEHLQHNACEMAIAGAVNLYLHPSTYTSLCAYNMLSVDGRCKSFGQGANGFVPGEGVGTVLLKRLSKAIEDEDQIYGVIRGTSVNHGGKTNGYTVPNPNAQSELIRSAFERAGVDARTVSYIEAHGTGTELGDPIEIAGLTQAFQKDTADTGFCAIGSVKSNLGHLEAAAGMAGLTKILLQMKHRRLVPSLHATELNDKIDFSKTPFAVQREFSEWKRPVIEVGAEKTEYPRIAGLSSFGAGGSNAHIVVEEYVREGHRSSPPVDASNPAVILLSARNPERLKDYAGRLLQFVEAKSQDIDLADLAYTLQLGREPMEERVGLLADSLKTLGEKLRDFIQGKPHIEGLHLGQVNQSKEAMTLFAADEDMRQLIDTWIAKRKYCKILDLWVQGLLFDWTKLYGPYSPKRISAPTYPFVRDTYWFDLTKPMVIENGHAGTKPQLPPEPKQAPELTAETLLEQTRKQWVSVTEAWVPTSAEVETAGWTAKIEAAKGQSILVISEESANYADVRGVCEAIAKITQSEQNLWEITHLPLQPDKHAIVDEAQLKPFFPNPDAPKIVFLMLPSAGEAGARSGHLELTYSCIQSLLKVAAGNPVRLYFCYEEDEPEAALYGEGLSGLLKSAMLESINHRYRSIAYDAQLVASGQLALKVVQEWLCDETTEVNPVRVPMIRYANSERFELQINETAAYRNSAQSAAFRPGGTYLIVGGLGEVGEGICCELGRKFGAQLVILSRRAEEAVKTGLQRIEAAGATVLYRSVDILDLPALRQTMQFLKDEGIEIHGVIHMARRVSDAPIVKKSSEEFSAVMSAKVEGTWNIDVVTAGYPLEFFLVYSSMAAFGIRGSSDYAYSTAFQNAFCRYRNRLLAQGKRNGKATSICWGQWEKDGGMDPEKMPMRLERMRKLGIGSIDIPASMNVMQVCLNDRADVMGFVAANDRRKVLETLGFDQVIPCPVVEIENKIEAFEKGELSKREFSAYLKTLPDSDLTEQVREKIVYAIRQSEQKEPPAVVKAMQPDHQGRKPQRQSVTVASKEPITESDPEADVMQRIIPSVEKVLKIKRDQLKLDKPLQDYGLDSITAMQLATTLEKEMKFPVPTQWLIEFPTLTKLEEKLSEYDG